VRSRRWAHVTADAAHLSPTLPAQRTYGRHSMRVQASTVSGDSLKLPVTTIHGKRGCRCTHLAENQPSLNTAEWMSLQIKKPQNHAKLYRVTRISNDLRLKPVKHIIRSNYEALNTKQVSGKPTKMPKLWSYNGNVTV